MDLTVDYAFKQMFGSEKNKRITIVFLNVILQRTGRDTIKEVEFINQEVGGEYKDDKQSRLDIVVRTQKVDLINIEVQLSNEHNIFKRSLFPGQDFTRRSWLKGWDIIHYYQQSQLIFAILQFSIKIVITITLSIDMKILQCNV